MVLLSATAFEADARESRSSSVPHPVNTIEIITSDARRAALVVGNRLFISIAPLLRFDIELFGCFVSLFADLLAKEKVMLELFHQRVGRVFLTLGDIA
ncbi:hypothetical protein ATY75_03415 [Rhizobium sp. N122]|nr:hypothetical protein ATY75_03415 [Rhizobium sp. N122]